VWGDTGGCEGEGECGVRVGAVGLGVLELFLGGQLANCGV